MKKIAIVPLGGMLLFAIISLTSGLDYYIERKLFFFVPILFVFALYYFLQSIVSIEEEKRRKKVCFLITIGVSAFFSLLFIKFIWLGMQNIWYSIIDRANTIYSLEIPFSETGDGEYAMLALFAIAGTAAVVSLWLYEAKNPMWISIVPSLLLFCLSLVVDGTPEEWCIVGYGAFLCLFLTLGKYGKAKKLLAACGLLILILTVGIQGPIWSKVESKILAYRHSFNEMLDVKSIQPAEVAEEKIDFGRYERSGIVEYKGYAAMQIYSRVDLRHSLVYLRGYVGERYNHNQWVGTIQKDDDPMGSAFMQNSRLEMQKAADRGTYYSYIIDEEMPSKYKKTTLTDYIKIDIYELPDENYDVSKELKKRIEDEILKGKHPKTLGAALKCIRSYLKKYCRYTLSPGAVEQGGELETFLFDRRTGYCTHYATAAVMILRTIGIPARLAQGYMIPGDEIPLAEWTPVTDQKAHAWVEIYIPGAGWYPFDATTFAVPVPGQTLPFDETILQKKEEKTETAKKANIDRSQDKEETTAPTHPPLPEQTGDPQTKETISAVSLQKCLFYAVIVGMSAIAAIILLRLIIRRYQSQKRQKQLLQRYQSETELSEKIVLAQDIWTPYLEKIGIYSVYEKRETMIQNYMEGLRNYVPSEQITKLYQETEFFVNICFLCRYGNQAVREEEYARWKAYWNMILHAISQNEDQKGWKILRKCCIVEECMNKKKKDR